MIKLFFAKHKIAVGVVALVLVGLGAYTIHTSIKSGDDKIAEVAAEKGRAEVTADNLAETVKRTEQGNEARNEIKRDDNVRRASCLRNSRTPENC